MHYYKHNIGDFDKATRHLTRVERSIYRDLIELYYDTEQPLTLDKAALCRRIIARSTDEVTAVEQVLNEFFNETPSGWYHDRCEEELAEYRANNSQKSQAGKASAAARAARKQQALNGRSTDVQTGVATDVERTSNGTPTKQKPVTINQEPDTSPIGDVGGASASHADPSAKKMTAADLVALGVDKAAANSWLLVRKEKRTPLTRAAWEQLVEEAGKAGISPAEAVKFSAGMSWQGFRSTWYEREMRDRAGGAVQQGRPSTRQDARAATAAAIFDDTPTQGGAASGQVIDAEFTVAK